MELGRGRRAFLEKGFPASPQICQAPSLKASVFIESLLPVFPVEGRKPPERCPFGRFFYVWKGIVVCGLLGWQGGKRCKKMVMRLGDSCRVFPLLPERLEEMGTEGAAWKRCLRARILLRTLSFPEVFQHPVEYMAMERVIRGQGGMIEILGGIVEHPEPPHEAL